MLCSVGSPGFARLFSPSVHHCIIGLLGCVLGFVFVVGFGWVSIDGIEFVFWVFVQFL